jgi:predicted kinase
MDNIFLYLLGFAGTGKLTIARAFARSVGAKVVDNHWINNPIFGLIDPDGVSPLPDAVWSQTAKVREAVLETIATLAKPGANFVFTHDGIEGERYDADVWRGIQSAAARRGARLIPVRLVCNDDELVRRIQSDRSRADAQMHRSRRCHPQESPPCRARSQVAWDFDA